MMIFTPSQISRRTNSTLARGTARNAEALAGSQEFVERVSSMKQNNDERHRHLIRKRLEAIMKAYSYESVLLLDTKG